MCYNGTENKKTVGADERHRTKKRGEKMYTESFASKLKKARNETGYTQEEVAKLMSIDRSALAKYETSKLEPSLETLAKLADFYCVSVDWLLGTKGGK